VLLRDLWSLLKNTGSDWYEDRAQRIGAALAYYTIFALTPGIVILMALAGVLLGPAAESRILGQFHELIGEQGAKAIEATVRSARATPPGTAELILSLVTLVLGLWGVFGELQDGLNTIWGVTPKAGRRVRDIVKERFWSFAMVVGIGFLLLVSLAMSAWLIVVDWRKAAQPLAPQILSLPETGRFDTGPVIIDFEQFNLLSQRIAQEHLPLPGSFQNVAFDDHQQACDVGVFRARLHSREPE